VSVHPGWTLSPTSVTETPAYQPEHVRETVAQQPQSRWTSTPAVPAIPSIPEPEPVAVVEPAVEPPTPAASGPGWASEWEAVAATPASPGAPLALHTAAVAAIDAVLGTTSAQAAWTAAPADLQEAPQPAPRPAQELTALDLPLAAVDRETATPLALEAARAIPSVPAAVAAPPPLAVPLAAGPVAVAPLPAAPPRVAVVPPPARVLPKPPVVAPPAAAPTRPAPPASRLTAPSLPPPAPAPRGSVLPSAAQQVLERAIRTAPSAPAQRRSTVRLGFADASVIDLRPDDPIAKALHTVADALIGREHR
jgi:hypothetical protein